jgi:F420-dependent oxidoreductase-like protein
MTPMQVGVIVPQGWTGEYDGWDAGSAWERTVAVSRQAERLGFESIWLFDHLHTVPRPTDELTFESFTTLSALAALTERVRLGHIVICNGFRNPALVAKMIGTMDVLSGGRMELGIGAGWKREEWLAYGYPFPETRVRLGMLREALEIIGRMRGGARTDRAAFDGEHYRVAGAINQPRGTQAPVPVMVGGNGPNVTWRLAARYADELNLDGLSPAEVREALPVIAARCAEIGRDPASLRVSVHAWWGSDAWRAPGTVRRALLRDYATLGVARVMGLLQESATEDGALERLAEDVAAAGLQLAS